MATDSSFDDILNRIQPQREGRVRSIVGPVIRAELLDSFVGELCNVRRLDGSEMRSEVIGFDGDDVMLLALEEIGNTGSRAVVTPLGSLSTIPCGDDVMGRVIDALGKPLDGKKPLSQKETTVLTGRPPAPLSRARIDEPIHTGIRAIDGLLTIGRGQRVGLFAAAGVGKSTLLGALARNVDADRVVVALIGERGREVREFIEDSLGREGLAKSTVVVSTSDDPALLRLRAAYAATAIAEAWREKGHRVLLLMDSVTRFARALREVGLSAGEPPGRQGFPASVFAALPRLFERAGNSDAGSITAIYTVLVTGDDFTEPVTDETISLLDGHVVLSRDLANRGHYPAIDILRSISRIMNQITDDTHQSGAREIRRLAESYEKNVHRVRAKLVTDAKIVGDVRRYESDVESFLKQDLAKPEDYNSMLDRLEAGFSPGGE